MPEFAEMVRTERERRGIRAYDLAYALGQTPSWVSRLESGGMANPPSLDVMTKLAETLGVSEAALLESLGYHVAINEDVPPYDAVTATVLQKTAHWTPAMKALLWRYVDAINDAIDEQTK